MPVFYYNPICSLQTGQTGLLSAGFRKTRESSQSLSLVLPSLFLFCQRSEELVFTYCTWLWIQTQLELINAFYHAINVIAQAIVLDLILSANWGLENNNEVNVGGNAPLYPRVHRVEEIPGERPVHQEKPRGLEEVQNPAVWSLSSPLWAEGAPARVPVKPLSASRSWVCFLPKCSDSMKKGGATRALCPQVWPVCAHTAWRHATVWHLRENAVCFRCQSRWRGFNAICRFSGSSNWNNCRNQMQISKANSASQHVSHQAGVH